jgi:hypothetical protein
MRQDNATCKGSWRLGTACGDCSRCLEEAKTAIPELISETNKLRLANSNLAAAMSCVPPPTKTPSADWMLEYMDWWLRWKTRCDKL